MARGKKNESLVHGVDCTALGSRYASRLMWDTKTQIVDLPELKTHPVYATLDSAKQAEVLLNGV